MHYYFTWGEFGLTMTVALLIYYLIVVCHYRKELGEFFKGRTTKPYAEPDHNAMGGIKEDEAEMSLVHSKDLDLAGSEGSTVVRDRNKILLLGGLADFMHELKTLVRITIEGEDTKENFLSLFGLIAGKYAQLMDGSFNESITSYVIDSNLPFEITAGDIEPILNNLNNLENEEI
jgi:hypothetical protein